MLVLAYAHSLVKTSLDKLKTWCHGSGRPIFRTTRLLLKALNKGSIELLKEYKSKIGQDN